MDVNEILRKMVAESASDVHLKSGQPPLFRVDGELRPRTEYPVLTTEDTEKIALSLMNPSQKNSFSAKNEMDLAYYVPNLARFRANVFRQKGTVEIVMRAIPMIIPTLEELSLPPVLTDIAMYPRGLVLVTGITGSGKSTAIAAMVDNINRNRAAHIITIEDPIEFMYTDQKSSLSQREVGLDTDSFSVGLKFALRQDPDVIVIGEMRDQETALTAMMAAETGHLVFSTLHTLDAAQTIDRLIDMFSSQQHDQIRMQLANTLAATVSLRLLARKDAKGRVPAVEIMIATPLIKTYIREKKNTSIRQAIIEGSSQYKMQTFDMSLLQLYKGDLISKEDALNEATNPNDLSLRMKGIGTSSVSARSQIDETGRQEVDNKLSQSRSLIVNKRAEEATELLKSILKQYPDNAEAAALLKEAHGKLSEESKKTEMRRYISQGISLFQQDKVEEAMSVWRNCLALDPDNKQVISLIKETEQKLGTLKTPEAMFAQAQAMVMQKRWAEASMLLNELLSVKPDFTQAMTLSREVKTEMDKERNLNKSKEIFEQAINLVVDQDWMGAAQLLYKVLLMSPQHREAKAQLAQAAAKAVEKSLDGFNRESPSWDFYYKQASMSVEAYVKEDYVLAFASFKKIFEKAPTHAPTRQNMDLIKAKIAEITSRKLTEAEGLYKLGRTGEAVLAWKEVVKLDPFNKTAKDALDKLGTKLDEQVVTLYQDGINAFNKNQFQEAVRCWERVLELNPTHENAKANLARAREKLNP